MFVCVALSVCMRVCVCATTAPSVTLLIELAIATAVFRTNNTSSNFTIVKELGNFSPENVKQKKTSKLNELLSDIFLFEISSPPKKKNKKIK